MKQLLFIYLCLFSIAVTAQQTDFVDFKKAQITLNFNTSEKTVLGFVQYSFDILRETDSIYLDAKGFDYVKYTLEGGEESSDYDGRYLKVKQEFKPGRTYSMQIEWKVKPKKALYFLGWDSEAPNQIWTQGQGKYTSNWLPSIDDMNDKIEFDLKVEFDSDYEVLANGKRIEKVESDSTTLWVYDMQEPMSSYLVALAIGKYDKKTEVSETGIPLEMYYYPQDSVKYEPTYRFSKQMFDFLEEEIGVPYPWYNYKQVPVYDFLYAGMENTSLTIFADTFVTDSIGFADRNYVNVNAHELAHQWFGNLVTETSGTHHWLHEGFATYYALLAEKEIFGDDHFYWQLYKTAQQLEAQDLAGKSTALLDPNSNSLTFYQKGAWALVMLRDKVGDRVFKNAIQSYLEKYKFKNVSTPDFLEFIEELGSMDLTVFAYDWLRNEDFLIDEAMNFLKSKSTFIHEYLMVDCELKSSKCHEYLSSGISDEAKAKVISQAPSLVARQTFNSSIKVRQSIAQNLSKIPLELKADYENLLNDDSYATIEAALYHLWMNFPEDRVKYLSNTRNIIGFSDKNVRLLWLALHLVTPEFEPNEKESVYKELLAYSSKGYSYDIREKAFTFLDSINVCNDICKQNLKEATKHHNWRLQKFAKQLLEKS